MQQTPIAALQCGQTGEVGGADFACSYWRVGASHICQSVHDQRKFLMRSQLGPAIFPGPLLATGREQGMKAEDTGHVPLPGNTGASD